jgi:hypothetical protein
MVVTWEPPKPSRGDIESVIAYWREILAIPDTEQGAELLRTMAAERLRTLETQLAIRRRADSLRL